MAKIVPERKQDGTLPIDLAPGQTDLLNALIATLDDEWTIFVRPFLNGIRPDFIIFSPNAGLGMFLVSDLNLDEYRASADGYWEKYHGEQGGWLRADIDCPLERAQRYKDDLTTYELPELDAKITLNKLYYALLSTFVFFPKYTSQQVAVATGQLMEEYPYTGVFGCDWLNPKMMGQLLGRRHLKKGSRFSNFMHEADMQARLMDAAGRSQYGRLDHKHIQFALSRDQQRLMLSEPGGKRVIGSAGSGKSIILARKAVAAAKANKSVLLVCYNITMTNYLNDIVRRLARHESEGDDDIGRRILVRHYHRIFPDGWELEDPDVGSLKPFDVVLIDEGQDFHKEWINNVFALAGEMAHRMFVEDDRQNIYGTETREKRAVRGIIGSPMKLKGTFRLNNSVAEVANRLITLSGKSFESGDLEPVSPRQVELFRPIWVDGAEESLLATLAAEVRRMIKDPSQTAPADIAILVCSYEDGWKVSEQLDTLGYPYICTFETRGERRCLEKKFSGERLEMRLDDLRRARKLAFWMRGDRIKVCTIHSFKGWELRRVLIFFNPTGEEQGEVAVPLLYTAITRSQESLMVLNADPQMVKYGQALAREGLVERRVATAPSAPPT